MTKTSAGSRVVDIAATLRGGKPRTLGRAPDVVEFVLRHPGELGDLIECIFGDDEIVRMLAADALEKVCRQHPDWLTPHFDRVLTDVAAVPQPSVQWHVAQMIGKLHLNKT